MELDEFIQFVKEQQGIDLSGVLTTADKIGRPEKALERQAIIDFENRNPMAGGGMLVQPGFGGVRQGYKDEKTTLKAATKELRELYNNDKLTKKIIELVKKEPDNYNSILKKINSYKNNKYKYSSNNLSNVLTILANENRIDPKYTVDKTGTPKYVVNKRNAKIDKLINVSPDKLPTAQSIGEKVGATTTTVTNYLKKSKGEDWVEQNYGKERFKRYGDIPLRTQFLNYVLNNSIEKFTVKNIIKNTDIKTKKEANSIYSKLLSDIYDKRAPNIDRPVGYIDENINLKDLTKKLRSSDDFYDAYERKIGSLLLEAYDGNLNSKEYKKARETLTAYHNFIRPLNKKYPSIAQTIEHPIPYTFLTEVDAGKDPKNLINTTILGDKENTFKSKIDEVKIKLRRNLEKNPNDKKLLAQVEDMKKLETFLTKETGMGFGTIKANFTDPRVQDLDFGAQTFGKKKITTQIKKSLKVREKAVDFFNKFKNDPKVINLFENAGVSAKVFRMLGGLRKGNVPLFLKEMDNILKNNPALKNKLAELPIFDEYSDIQNQYAALDTGTMSDVNMNLSLPESVKKEVVPAEAIGAATLPLVERGKKILSGLGKGIAGIDLPLVQALFAAADPTSLFYTLPFTDLAAKQTNLYKPAKTKTGQVIKSVLRGTPAKFAERVFPIVSRASIPVSLGYGISEVAKAAKPNYYIDPETQEPTFYNRDFAQNVLPGFMDLSEQAANIAKKEGISYQEALNKINVEDFVSNVQGPGEKIEPFAGGGRAGFKLGTVRKMVQAKIDEAVEQSPKDITSTLDKLIKKTLDEDFFDKKDRIIDTLNAKIAKERKKFPYNQQVQEEPSQLEFYDDITKSNFRTKTGEYFDRIRRRNKAGGGILKQAGDRSGPPPESGPMSQGLPGLLKRGMKI